MPVKVQIHTDMHPYTFSEMDPVQVPPSLSPSLPLGTAGTHCDPGVWTADHSEVLYGALVCSFALSLSFYTCTETTEALSLAEETLPCGVHFPSLTSSAPAASPLSPPPRRHKETYAEDSLPQSTEYDSLIVGLAFFCTGRESLLIPKRQRESLSASSLFYWRRKSRQYKKESECVDCARESSRKGSQDSRSERVASFRSSSVSSDCHREWRCNTQRREASKRKKSKPTFPKITVATDNRHESRCKPGVSVFLDGLKSSFLSSARDRGIEKTFVHANFFSFCAAPHLSGNFFDVRG